MRTMSDTISRLSRMQASRQTPSMQDGHLARLEPPAHNPGDLAGWYQLPEGTQEPPALVVVLHGCTQNAATYDAGAGWSRLAADMGFAVLFPEQSRKNNANLCFNWFNPADIQRGKGEAASIRAMIGRMVEDHGIDPGRIFITGLSAGGAMANALLAAYPDIFAGGAIIAGLPVGAATTIPQAFDRMRGHGLPSGKALRERLQSASRHTGPWPLISVWHGTADNTVALANAAAIIDQWSGVHHVAPASPDRHETLAGGYQRTVWTDAGGRPVIEQILVKGMGHGTPVAAATGYGAAGPFMLETGLSSTLEIARHWGLADRAPAGTMAPSTERAGPVPTPGTASGASIRSTIDSALRAAGLLR